MNTTARISPLRGRIPSWGLDDRLRKVRRDMGMTQEQLAAALGVGSKAYGAWEAGTNRPGDVLKLAENMERISGVPRQWFIGWIEEATVSPLREVGPEGLEPPASSVKARQSADILPFRLPSKDVA